MKVRSSRSSLFSLFTFPSSLFTIHSTLRQFFAPQSPGTGRIDVMRRVRIVLSLAALVVVAVSSNVPRISTRWFSRPFSESV